MGHLVGAHRVLTVCLVLSGIALPAVAQDVPRAELSGGYQVFEPNEDNVFSSTQGWHGELAYNWNRYLGLVGEAGAGYNTREDSTTNGLLTTTTSRKVRVEQFMGGVRANARQYARAVWFGQILAGAVRVSAPSSGPGSTADDIAPTDVNETGTHFGLQFGFGSNIALSPRLGVRLGVDALRLYRRGEEAQVPPFGFGERANVLRFTVGAVVPLGRL